MDHISHAGDRPTDAEGAPLRLALVWRGDPDAPDRPTRHQARLQPLAEALAAAGVEVEPVV